MFQTCAGKCDCVCMESERTRKSKRKIGGKRNCYSGEFFNQLVCWNSAQHTSKLKI